MHMKGGGEESNGGLKAAHIERGDPGRRYLYATGDKQATPFHEKKVRRMCWWRKGEKNREKGVGHTKRV